MLYLLNHDGLRQRIFNSFVSCCDVSWDETFIKEAYLADELHRCYSLSLDLLTKHVVIGQYK